MPIYLILNEYFTNSKRGYTIVFRKSNDVFLSVFYKGKRQKRAGILMKGRNVEKE